MDNDKLPRINRRFLQDSDFEAVTKYLESVVWLEIKRRLTSEETITKTTYNDMMFAVTVLKDLTQNNSPEEQA